jgi:hypothetical protein
MSDGLPALMRAQIAAEMRYHSPWITDRDPPNVPKTYLTSCINKDGARYVACHYWYKRWASPGPYVTVVGWCEAPEPI